jgi:hypothetical protein
MVIFRNAWTEVAPPHMTFEIQSGHQHTCNATRFWHTPTTDTSSPNQSPVHQLCATPPEHSPKVKDESIIRTPMYIMLDEPALSLKSLVLSGTSVTNSGLACLSAFPYLHTLELCDSGMFFATLASKCVYSAKSTEPTIVVLVTCARMLVELQIQPWVRTGHWSAHIHTHAITNTVRGYTQVYSTATKSYSPPHLHTSLACTLVRKVCVMRWACVTHAHAQNTQRARAYRQTTLADAIYMCWGTAGLWGMHINAGKCRTSFTCAGKRPCECTRIYTDTHTQPPLRLNFCICIPTHTCALHAIKPVHGHYHDSWIKLCVTHASSVHPLLHCDSVVLCNST